MTLLLWQLPCEDPPIIECCGSRYGVQYYRFYWKNIFPAIAVKFRQLKDD